MKRLVIMIFFILFANNVQAATNFRLLDNSSIGISQSPYPLTLTGTFALESNGYWEDSGSFFPIYKIINSNLTTSETLINLSMEGDLYFGLGNKIVGDNLKPTINNFQRLPEYDINSSKSFFVGSFANPESIAVYSTSQIHEWNIFAERSDVVITPEPTSILLFGVGGVAMAFRRFRQKKA